VEGRDQSSGDSFIMIGPEDDREADMYVTRDSAAGSVADLDFIAAARIYLPLLIDEVVRARRGTRSAE
jgi:hypothetical protein